MNIYIFEDVAQLTRRYHNSGGLVVVAKDKKDVEELIENDEYIQLSEEDWKNCTIYKLRNNEQKKYFVFPDAGCC